MLERPPAIPDSALRRTVVGAYMPAMEPGITGERLTRISVTTFRRTLRSALRTARSRPVLLTWHGGEAAVVAPVPKGYKLGAEE